MPVSADSDSKARDKEADDSEALTVEVELTEPFLDITLNALYGDAEWGQKGFRGDYMERVQSLIKLFSIKLREAQKNVSSPDSVGHIPVELTDRQLDVLIQACYWDLDFYRNEYDYDYKRVLGIAINVYEKAKAEIKVQADNLKREAKEATLALMSLIPKKERKLRGDTDLDDFIKEDDWLNGIYF